MAETPTTPRLPSDSSGMYACAMHPQVRQTGPGNCRICGMPLKAAAGRAEIIEDYESVDMTERF